MFDEWLLISGYILELKGYIQNNIDMMIDDGYVDSKSLMISKIDFLKKYHKNIDDLSVLKNEIERMFDYYIEKTKEYQQ